MNTTPSHVPASAESEEPGGRILETSTSTVATNLSSLQSATTEEVGAAISQSTHTEDAELPMHPAELQFCKDIQDSIKICEQIGIPPAEAFPGRAFLDEDGTLILVGSNFNVSSNGRASVLHERLGRVSFSSILAQMKNNRDMGMLHTEATGLGSEFDKAVRDKRTELVRQNLHRIQEVPNFRLEDLPPKRTLD